MAPLRELNAGPSHRSPLQPRKHKPSPRSFCEILSADCLAEIAARLEPCDDLISFRQTSTACRDSCAVAGAEYASLSRRGYKYFKLSADARPSAEPASRLSIAAVSLNSVLGGPQDAVPSHLAVCDAQHGGIELVSLASHAYERWGQVSRVLSGRPVGVVVTPKCVRVGSGARVDCEGLTFTILDKSASFYTTDGEVVLKSMTLNFLLGNSATIGPARLGTLMYAASDRRIVGVDTGAMYINTSAALPDQVGSICGIAAATNGRSDASTGYVFLLDSNGSAHVYNVSESTDGVEHPIFFSTIGLGDLKPPVTAIGAGVMQKTLRLIIADCGGTRLNVFKNVEFKNVDSGTGGTKPPFPP
jgi:hypothetical protein